MQSIGIVRKIDELGRIVIPKEVRKKLEILEQDNMEIFTDTNCIILKKYEPYCTFCGSDEKLLSYNNNLICCNCIKRIDSLNK